MLASYFRVLMRNLLRDKSYSFINISGLSIGITCSMLILLWVFDELSYDKFLPKSDRLYQVWANAWFDGKVNSWRSVPLPTYEALKSADSKIVNTAASDWGGEHLLTVGEKRINKEAYYVSEEFLTMFEFPLIAGNPAKVLSEPNAIVITESTAKAFFGEMDPINQVMRLDNKDELKVTGVLKDVPMNSSFQFDFLLPWKLHETKSWVIRDKTNWSNYSYQVYMELDAADSEQSVEASIAPLLAKNGEVDVRRELMLHPLERWRLYTNFKEGKEDGGMIDYVQMFLVIGIFVLVIACINFMNLATARSERRAREVGIRKSVGSRRLDIVLQFMGESIFIALIAFGIALLAAMLLLPFYNEMVQKQLSIDWHSPYFWLFAVGLIVFTGFVSGSYPALYLSSFQPATVLKGKLTSGREGSLPRKVLVTIQFGFSILLIIGTLVVYQQIRHVRGRDLGYDQENLITIDYTDQIEKNYHSLKTELLATGAVTAVTRSNSPITEIWSNNFLGWPGKPADLKVLFVTIAADYDFTRTMGIKVLEGRDFSEDFKSDTAAIIINRAAAELMQLKDPIGTRLDLWDKKRELIGITENVLMGSPDRPIGPAFMIYDPRWISKITLRLAKTNDLQESLVKVEQVFKKFNSAYPFEYQFADVQFQKKFTTIDLIGKLANIFATLAIVITGLGLFGLAAFTAEQRRKEIGIRKVMGASTTSLVALMSTDFSKLVLLAFVISAPFSWWAMNYFLERYPYRVDVPVWIFPLTGLVALLLALIIVITQAFRAARANPVQSLRSE